MALDLNRQGFNEVGDTAALQPMINCPPLPGGIAIAKVGASFAIVIPGETRKDRHGEPRKTYLPTRAIDAHRGRKCIAVCLGGRATIGGLPQAVPCNVAPVDCTSAPESAAKALESLVYAHDETALARKGEQHVIALLCLEPLDVDKHKADVREYESKMAALKATEAVYDQKTNAITKPADYLSRSALVSTWGGTIPEPPEAELVGFLSSAAWQNNDAPAQPRG